MINARAAGRSRLLLSLFVTFGLLLAIVPTAPVSAQSTLDQALVTLRKVPGLKAQIPRLQVTTNAGDAAEWAAVGRSS